MTKRDAACLIGALVLAGGIHSAKADDCDAATTAAIAQVKVAHAVKHVMAEQGQPPSTFNMIFTGDKAYMQMNGEWHSMPFSAQQQIDMINAGKARGQQMPHACEKLPSPPINGEAVSLYDMHSSANGKSAQARMWISDKSGLPLKMEIHLDDGTVITDDYRYDNVKPPADAK